MTDLKVIRKMLFLGKYLMDVVINMTKRYQDKKMWPEMTGNRLV